MTIYMKCLFLFVFFCSTAAAQHQTSNILNYGASPEGITSSTVAIQQAINDMEAVGGGTVIIPTGKFLTGVIYLKHNTGLYLDSGAVLLGSTNRDDYGASKKAKALIMASGVKNIFIKGAGIIDAGGTELMQDIFKKLRSGQLQDDQWKEAGGKLIRRPAENNRPHIIDFKNCEGITIKNVHLQNGSCWIQQYSNCNNIVIDSMQVTSNSFWNNDGLDLVDCKNAVVSNCNINCADDGICLKSENAEKGCDSISIVNCRIRSSANAVKLGTSSLGGFRNIVIKDIEVYDTYRSAIAIEAVDGGKADGIEVANINAVNTGNAIFIRLGHRNKNNRYSTLKNVHISHVKVQVPAGKADKGYPMEGPLLKYPPDYNFKAKDKLQSISPWNDSSVDSNAVRYRHNVFPSSITGIPGHPVENVTIENVEIIYRTIADKNINYFPLDSFKLITEAEKAYPEFSMFGELPVWGFYIRHVDGLSMKNISLRMKGRDFRTALLFNDVKNFSLHKIKATGKFGKPVIFYNDVQKQ